MIQSLLRRVASHLHREKIPYMVVGGQAVLLYGLPRLTRGIDITLGVASEKLPKILKICEKLRLRVLHTNPVSFVTKTQVLPVEDGKSKVRVDFIFSFTPYEGEAIRRARAVRVKGYPVRFASCEDLIIHKLFAGRAIDHEDVKGILRRNLKKLDYRYVKKWLREFGKLPGREGLLRRFNQLVNQTRPLGPAR